MSTKLVKIYRDNVVFLIDNSRIEVEKISSEALNILNYFEKIKKYNL